MAACFFTYVLCAGVGLSGEGTKGTIAPSWFQPYTYEHLYYFNMKRNCIVYNNYFSKLDPSLTK